MNPSAARTFDGRPDANCCGLAGYNRTTLTYTGSASAYFCSPVEEFVATGDLSLLGCLTNNHGFPLDIEQRNAWSEEFAILRGALAGLTGTLYLEFEVPRLGSRIDAVLVSGPAILPIEFKCGEQEYLRTDYNQVWDYALDLRNFHRASDVYPS